MFASQWDVDALIFTFNACPTPPFMNPSGHVSDIVHAAANLFCQSTVAAGDSIVAPAAASREHSIPAHVHLSPAVAASVAVAPAFVPTAVTFDRVPILLR